MLYYGNSQWVQNVVQIVKMDIFYGLLKSCCLFY